MMRLMLNLQWLRALVQEHWHTDWQELTSGIVLVRCRAVAQLMGIMKPGSAGQPTARAQLASRSTASRAASSSRLLAGCSSPLDGPSSSNT